MIKGGKYDLGYLGEDFQYKLIHAFMEDKEFFKDLSEIIDQNMFTNPALKVFVGVMKEYYEREEAVPSYQMMGIALNEKSHNEIERETYASILRQIQTTESDGIDYVRKLAEKFFKQQNIVKTANEILRIAGDGDTSKYEKCVELLNEALNKGNKDILGSKVFDDIGETLSDDYRIAIPTGIGKVDEALEGGIGKGELGVIVGPSSFGKAQPLTSKILTPNGWKYMGGMNVGDTVIGRDGSYHKVSGVFPQGLRPIYKVTLSNGAECECDIEHLWNVNSYYQRRGKKYVKRIGKKCYEPDLTYNTMSLREIIDRGIVKHIGNKTVYNFKVPKMEAVSFKKREISLDPYLYGYFLGDGCTNNFDITVGELDKSFMEKELKSVLKEDLSINKNNGRNTWRFAIHGKNRKSLNEILGKSLAHNKKIHEDYLFNTKEIRISLLQGLMDSDGCSNKNGSCEFSSKSKELAEQVKWIVESLGGFASLTESDSGYFSKKHCERIECGKRYRVTISMCDESIKLFRLDRKQEMVKYRSKNKEALYIKSAEYVRHDYAQCIMVDSDEHLYITDDFIVTHNTSMTTAMAAHAATYKCENNGYNGFKVLQIVFEDRIKQIQRKHIGRITGIEAKDLSKPDRINEVREKIAAYGDYEMLQQNLKIVRFPSGELTANTIYRFIKKLIALGFRPDLVIIDYFECLAHLADSSSNEYEREGKTMRRLEAMAGELDMAFWIPTQGTKDSVNLELVTMDKAGGSFKKIQIAHIVMSIARSMEDIDANRATIAILKNRAGKSGKVFNNVEFNNGTCRISTDHVDEFDNIIDYNKNTQKQKDDVISAIYQMAKANKMKS